MPAMADSKVASAATALEPHGSGSCRTKTGDVDIRATVDALINIASKPSWKAREWDWDARDYPDWDWDLNEIPPHHDSHE